MSIQLINGRVFYVVNSVLFSDRIDAIEYRDSLR